MRGFTWPLSHVSRTDHGGKLEKDIMGDTSGHYQKMLVTLLQVRGEGSGITERASQGGRQTDERKEKKIERKGTKEGQTERCTERKREMKKSGLKCQPGD